MIAPPQITAPKAIYTQIAEHVRALIVAGQIAPGTKLPTTEQLAAAWHTTPKTIQNALAPLVKEGLLTRQPKRGTFVRDRTEKLTCVAVYLGGALYAESQYRQAVQAAVQDELQRAGIEADIWIDPRPDTERGEPWMPMVRAAEHREFQGLIVAAGQPDRLRWLRKLPVPAAALGGVPDMPGRVESDIVQIADVSLAALARQGCRSAGAIMPVNPSDGAATGGRSGWVDFCERFLELAGPAGMTVKNEWMRLLHRNAAWHGAREHERYGYEQFRELWRQRERPQGLLVYDDTTARGVILALREQQVRVPEELKLVLHKNEATDLFCPVPATFMVLSERAIARALVSQVQKQFRGERCEPITVPFRLRAHNGPDQQQPTQ